MFNVGVDAYPRSEEFLTVSEVKEVLGGDISFWQGKINPEQLFKKLYFIFLRAGYGNDTIDPRFFEYHSQLTNVGMPLGYYWYLKPGKDWAKHAVNFSNIYNNYPSKLYPVADIEESGGLGKTILESWIYKFTQKFKSETGKDVMIYTSPGFWDANLPLTSWAKHLELWVAHWTAGSPILPLDWRPKNNPYGYPHKFHQFTSKADGNFYGVESKSLDLNRYNGTLEQFNEEFGTNLTPKDETPPVEPDNPTYVIPTGNLRVRTSPTTTITSNIVGLGTPSNKFKYIGEEGDWTEAKVYLYSKYLRKE